MEIPGLTELYPKVGPAVLDLRGTPEEKAAIEVLSAYHYANDQRLSHEKWEAQMKAKILALATDQYAEIRVAGYLMKISKSPIKETTIQRKAYVMTRLSSKKFDTEIDNTPDVVKGLA